jgi:hypothetical protein
VIVAVTSWRGTGATTTALLLAGALACTDETWLIEADPAGGVLSGRLHVGPGELAGLERLSFPTDTTVPSPDSLAHHRGTLHVLTAPVDPFRAHSCHTPRVPWLPTLRELGRDVVVDVGRMRHGTPAWPLLALADTVVTVTSPEVSAAVASSEWWRAAGRVSSGDPGLDADQVRVVAVDAPGGVAFDRTALADEFGSAWGGWLPWEPTIVDLVHRGAGLDDRRLRRSALVAASIELASALARREVVPA